MTQKAEVQEDKKQELIEKLIQAEVDKIIHVIAKSKEEEQAEYEELLAESGINWDKSIGVGFLVIYRKRI